MALILIYYFMFVFFSILFAIIVFKFIYFFFNLIFGYIKQL